MMRRPAGMAVVAVCAGARRALRRQGARARRRLHPDRSRGQRAGCREGRSARAASQRSAPRVRRGGADVLVRINRPLSLAVRDIEASVGPDVDGFVLPKVGSADHVRLLEEHIAEIELRRGLVVGHSRLIVLIETRGGVAGHGRHREGEPADRRPEPGHRGLRARLRHGAHCRSAAGRQAARRVRRPRGADPAARRGRQHGRLRRRAGFQRDGAAIATVRIHGCVLHPSRAGGDPQRALRAIARGSRSVRERTVARWRPPRKRDAARPRSTGG